MCVWGGGGGDVDELVNGCVVVHVCVWVVGCVRA